MKRLMQSVFAAALLIAAASNVQAQESATRERREAGDRRGGPQDEAEQMTARMTESLQLTDAQRTKVLAINQKYVPQIQQLRETYANGDRAAMHEKMGPLRQQHAAEVKAVLTPEQQAAWDKQKTERPQKGSHGARAESGPRDASPTQIAERQTANMTEVLKLDDAQRTKVLAINQKYAEQHAALRDAHGTDREALLVKRKQLGDQQIAELKTVLTPEQWATWERERPGKRAGQHQPAQE